MVLLAAFIYSPTLSDLGEPIRSTGLANMWLEPPCLIYPEKRKLV